MLRRPKSLPICLGYRLWTGGTQEAEHVGSLQGPEGPLPGVHLAPRLLTDDMTVLRVAALKGVGVAKLPLMVLHEDLTARLAGGKCYRN